MACIGKRREHVGVGADVVAEQRDHADERGQHRQHQRRRAGLLLRDRVAAAEAEEAGEQGKILEEREKPDEPEIGVVVTPRHAGGMNAHAS